MQKNTLDQISQQINQAEEIIIACEKNFDSDAVAAALSLYLSLTKLGKKVEIITSKQTTVEFAKYVGVDKVEQELSSRKFIISLKNVLGSVDKVSHYLEGDELNIVVHTIPGAARFTQDQVSFRYARPSTQLIILVGVVNLEDLGKIYTQEQEMFSNTQLIVIKKGQTPVNFSALAIGDNKLTISESVAELLNQLKLPIDVDIAANLFLGIADSTNNFQDQNLTPESLEAAAFCLRMKNQTAIATMPNFDLQALPDLQTASPATVVGQPQSPSNQPQTETDQKDQTTEQPKEDWLTPKIYKSSSQI